MSRPDTAARALAGLDQRIAAWKLPERLEVRAALPMTPSGKIQKYLLREEIAGLLGQKALIR